LNVGLVSGETHEPHIKKEKARNHVCQRRRKDVLDWIREAGGRSVPFPDRDQNEEPIPVTQPQRNAIAKVEEFTKHLAAVAEKDTKRYRKLMANWTVMHFHRRALSSPLALQRSLQNRIKKVKGQQKGDDEDEAVLSLSEAKAVALDEDVGEKLTDEEAHALLEKERFGTRETLAMELELLEDALEAAKKITPSRDWKLKELKQILAGRLPIKPKFIVFTKYKDTLEYLEKELGSDRNLRDTKIVTIHGEMGDAERKEKFRDFRRARRAVLIATDCISEGIDLQYMASQLVHYELPWNPNRLEQRNGRVDRYGQRDREVYIRLLVMEDPLDLAILRVLVKKAEQIREDYGFSPPFFGSETTVLDLLSEAGLDVTIRPQPTLFSFEGEERLQPKFDPFSNETINKIKDDSFYGQTRLDLADVQERLEETRKLIGSTDEIQRFIISGLRRFGTEIKEYDDGLFDFHITNETLLAPGIENEMKDVCFAPARAAKDPDLQLVDLGHPLVRQLIEQVKISSFEDKDRYGRTAYLTTEEAEEMMAVYHLLVRYSVKTTPLSLLEEIVPVGIPVYGKKKIDEETLKRLLKARAKGGERSEFSVKEALGDALTKELEPVFKQLVEERRAMLVEERQHFRERFEQEGSAEWVQGIDRVSLASMDLLTVSIHYPLLGGP